MKLSYKLLILALISALLSACSHHRGLQDGAPSWNRDVSRIPNAVPQDLPKSKYGNPSSYHVLGKTYHVLSTAKGYNQRGLASWYGTKFHGQLTSSREPYDLYGMTAASKNLPIPCFVKVTNLRNHKWVIVKVNDRGPFVGNRLIDLSYAAARKLDYMATGTALVQVEAITPGHSYSAPEASLPVYANNNTESGQYYLQLGAFSQRENAEALGAKLQEITSKPIHISPSPSKKIFKVQIGPMKNENETNQLKSTLDGEGFQAITVVS